VWTPSQLRVSNACSHSPPHTESKLLQRPNSIYPELRYPITLVCISRLLPPRSGNRSLRFREGVDQGLRVRVLYSEALQSITAAPAALPGIRTHRDRHGEHPVGRAPDAGGASGHDVVEIIVVTSWWPAWRTSDPDVATILPVPKYLLLS
jgi:hypothetical protein